MWRWFAVLEIGFSGYLKSPAVRKLVRQWDISQYVYVEFNPKCGLKEMLLGQGLGLRVGLWNGPKATYRLGSVLWTNMGLNFNPGWALSKGSDPAQPNSISNPLLYFGPFLWFIGGAKRRVKEKKVVWRLLASRVGHKPQPTAREQRQTECKLLCTYVCSVFRWAKMGACMHVYVCKTNSNGHMREKQYVA